MKVLVTGAAGFLGSRVVLALLDRGHAVRAVVRPASSTTPEAWQNRAEIVRADLRAGADLEKLFDGIDALIHLAATVRGSAEAQFVGSAVCTEKLLEAMQRAGHTKHVVLAGSCSVYDWTATNGTLTEESPLETNIYERDGYTVAKVWQERVARRMAAEQGWTLSIMRPGLIYGPGAVPAGSAGIGVGRAFLVLAPLSRLRLTHVDNCAAAFADAAEKQASGVFNVVDDEQVTAWRYAGRLLKNKNTVRIPVPYFAGLGIAHLAKLTSRILFPPKGGKLPGILIPRHYRARFKPLQYDNRRAKEALGWQCKAFFESGSDVI
jgi:nucleoside-diphosphate-sugar epimerase